MRLNPMTLKLNDRMRMKDVFEVKYASGQD